MGASEGFLGWIAYLGAANAGIPLSIIVKNYGWEVRRCLLFLGQAFRAGRCPGMTLSCIEDAHLCWQSSGAFLPECISDVVTLGTARGASASLRVLPASHCKTMVACR